MVYDLAIQPKMGLSVCKLVLQARPSANCDTHFAN